MKKILAASALGVGLAVSSAGGHNVQADEIIKEAVKGYSDEYASYYTKDLQGDYHHTKDGKWNQAMFDNKEWYFYLTDKYNKKHYFYFPKNELKVVIPDNNYSAPASHQEIQQDGYNVAVPSEKVNTEKLPTSININQQKEQYNTQAPVTNNAPAQTQQAPVTNNTSVKTQQAPAQTTSKASTQNTSNATASSNWVKNYQQIQPYGQYYGGGAHYGVDYAMNENTPVYSLTDGTVIQAGWSNYGGGNQVTIQEKNSDYYQWYMHMNSLNVSAGQTVSAGQQIGLSGSTGNSTTPHLHFQRMAGGVGNEYAVNPTNYINQQ
ncbi:M23 family peptidase [Macrococcus hajekii]|uniref:lysostaphin n=1 Tax=Macrococcus hajekii TaxID=198482 RepID=A0A4R6BNW2_9STAP|nr:M23 family metallopeptidase [Macrococcus hajekii]TDM03521.1 M23 family peptidase [Macrococcus hajekii]GGA99510.1 glycyl-glycine endopeptidase LytM [Macrococcus hajekii]